MPESDACFLLTKLQDFTNSLINDVKIMLLHAILLCRLMVITFYKCHLHCKTHVHAYNFSQAGTITRSPNSKKGNHENPSQQLLARNYPNQGWFPHQRSSLTFKLASHKCARCLLSSSTIITSSTRVFKTLVFLSHEIYKKMVVLPSRVYYKP